MATVALVVSTVVAAMVVSIGIARADGLGPADAATADGSFTVAVLLGLILAGWGGVTALISHGMPRHD